MKRNPFRPTKHPLNLPLKMTRHGHILDRNGNLIAFASAGMRVECTHLVRFVNEAMELANKELTA